VHIWQVCSSGTNLFPPAFGLCHLRDGDQYTFFSSTLCWWFCKNWLLLSRVPCAEFYVTNLEGVSVLR